LHSVHKAGNSLNLYR